MKSEENLKNRTYDEMADSMRTLREKILIKDAIDTAVYRSWKMTEDLTQELIKRTEIYEEIIKYMSGINTSVLINVRDLLETLYNIDHRLNSNSAI